MQGFEGRQHSCGSASENYILAYILDQLDQLRPARVQQLCKLLTESFDLFARFCRIASFPSNLDQACEDVADVEHVKERDLVGGGHPLGDSLDQGVGGGDANRQVGGGGKMQRSE